MDACLLYTDDYFLFKKKEVDFGFCRLIDPSTWMVWFVKARCETDFFLAQTVDQGRPHQVTSQRGSPFGVRRTSRQQ